MALLIIQTCRALLQTCRACLRADCRGRIYLSFQYHNTAPDDFLEIAVSEFGFKVCPACVAVFDIGAALCSLGMSGLLLESL